MIIYKFFALGEYNKKEEWINIMCSKGYALKDWSFCKYKFEKCNQEDFLNYLEDEWNVEYVCHYTNWVFFRRKKTLGKFSMFSNLESKIDYFRRILLFRLFAFIFLISFSILNILYSPAGSADKTFVLLLILIDIIIFAVTIPTFIKYLKLKKSDEN